MAQGLAPKGVQARSVDPDGCLTPQARHLAGFVLGLEPFALVPLVHQARKKPTDLKSVGFSYGAQERTRTSTELPAST